LPPGEGPSFLPSFLAAGLVLAAALDGFLHSALGGDGMHFLAYVGLVDGELNGEVDEVAGAPVEGEARSVAPQRVAEDEGHHDGHHAALGGVHAR